MKLKSTQVVDTNRLMLEIEVDADAFEKELNNVYKREVKRMNVPGFRKGKAPRVIVEQYYGPEIFFERAVNNLYPSALSDAITESGAKVIEDKMDFEMLNISKDGFTFRATVTTYPEVNIEDYKGIEYKEMDTEVTDDLIDDEIEEVRSRNARFVTVEDREVKNGDIAVIDYEGFKDGVPFEGGKAENYNLEIGEGNFIPGFEDQIVGHKTGEEFTIDVTFPEEYHSEELAGQPAQFKIVLHEIKEKELPELDDDFVKDVSSKETVAEYREEVKEKVAKRLEEQAHASKQEQVFTRIIDKLDADVPKAMFEQKLNSMVEDIKIRIKSQGLDFNTYLEYTGMTEEDIREQYRTDAENNVKLRVALTKIAELENIEVSDEDIEAEYEKVAEFHKAPLERVKKYVPRENLKADIMVNRAADLVMNTAVAK